MSRIAERLQQVRAAGRKGLVIYITGGCPNLAATVEAVLAAERAGADVVEIGIPFSDPMADGPVIQQAASLALANGASVEGILDVVRQIRTQSEIPLALMTYVNPVLQYDADKFVKTAKAAGVDGLIIPDLPIEESREMLAVCREQDVNLVQFVAPTTTLERLGPTCAAANGFIYCISNTGVTGARADIDYSALAPLITEVRTRSDVPTAIGFGIGSPAAAYSAAQYADAVIVGSAVVDIILHDGVQAIESFITTIRQALDKGMN